MLMNKRRFLWFLVLFNCIVLNSRTPLIKPLPPLERELVQLGFVNIQLLDSTIHVDLKYAAADNFTGVVLYDDGFKRAYLHPLAAEKLVKAQLLLRDIHPDFSLLIYDAVRPLHIQRKMYDVVKDTPKRAYVANPERTGLHNYGMAVDLTICDGDGKPIDMGTPFDYFGLTAGIRDEEGFIRKGLLTRRQVKNRQLLRKVMTEAGFKPILGEWWHFNAVSLQTARSQYKVVE